MIKVMFEKEKRRLPRGRENQTEKNELAWIGIKPMAFGFALSHANPWAVETPHLNHPIHLRYHHAANNAAKATLPCRYPKAMCRSHPGQLILLSLIFTALRVIFLILILSRSIFFLYLKVMVKPLIECAHLKIWVKYRHFDENKNGSKLSSKCVQVRSHVKQRWQWSKRHQTLL